METWLRNTTETDLMITCNHVSADGQFDSDASVPAACFFFNMSTLQCDDILTNHRARDANLSVRCNKLAGRHLAYYTLVGNYV